MIYQIIRHQHLFTAGRYFPQCHASTLECLPDGSLVAAWFAGQHEKAPDVAIWMTRCRQGQWDEPTIIADAAGIPCWNPVLFYDDGQLCLFYKVGQTIPQWQTMLRVSVDHGETWAEARELAPGDRGGRGPVKNKCIRLTDGSWLAPASLETATTWNCFTDRSTDGGQTWTSALVPVDRTRLTGKGIIQPTLWQGDDGRVHMLMRSTEGVIYRSHSDDLGASWSEAQPTALPNNNSGIDAVRLTDGRIVLVYNPAAGNWASRSPIVFAVSSDQGQTWGEPQWLDHVPCTQNEPDAEFSYPAVIARGKDLYITYTWKRRTIAFWQIRLD